jgi:hypothetical protein
VWLEEIGLGIGHQRGTYLGITREWLYWYDEAGTRYLTPEERVQDAEMRSIEAERLSLEAQQRSLEAQQLLREVERRNAILAEHLRSLGIAPNSLSDS